jgi:multidrug efflux pump subunit AcrA (membrane-fusion protein)
VVAEEAQVQVLHQQKIYQRVVAPFDGVITQRNVDIGSFVQADATSGTFMFTIMQGMSSEPRCSCREIDIPQS